MGSLVKKVTDKKMSRRTFLLASAAGTASLALAGCGNMLAPVSKSVDANAINGEGKWVAAACWHNCGGRCVNKALVVDGVVIRQKTDDITPDSPDHPAQRGCVRGRSQRKQVFSADRLKYPMKRKHWQPLTGGQKELRGKDEWERISWDEALNYVTAEIDNTIKKYGNRGIYCTGGEEIKRPLSLKGGFTHSWTTTSMGNTLWSDYFGLNYLNMDGNDRFDNLNCDAIILIGVNAAWSSQGECNVYYKTLRDAGVRFYAIDPFYNDTYAMLEAEWIPIRTGTDMALLNAVAYVMITEDDPQKRPIIDWEFLKKYTIGFDATMMPEGEDPKGNYKDYVLGTYDGIPKTPEWASEICGVSPVQIRELAFVLNKENNIGLWTGFAPARTNNNENFSQLLMTIAAMGGHIGKSGNSCVAMTNGSSGNSRPFIAVPGAEGITEIPNPIDDSINEVDVWEAILKGKYNYKGRAHEFKPHEERDIDVRLIYNGGQNEFDGQGTSHLQTKPNINKGIEVHRKKADFVVTHAYTLTTAALYSDIVLPVTTMWERIPSISPRRPEAFLAYQQVIEPMYEAKDDRWIAEEIGKRLGLDPKDIYPFSEKQRYFNSLATAMVALPNTRSTATVQSVVNLSEKSQIAPGYVSMVAITQADIDEWGVQGKPQEGVIPLKELLDNGVYRPLRNKKDGYDYIAYEEFIKDPVKSPRPTESGKFEIYCRTFKKNLMTTGYSGAASAIPSYQPAVDGYEETYKDWKTKTKGDRPFQVHTPHYMRRAHSTLDNVGWLRKAFTNPVFINASDAAAKEIKDGDTVLLSNQYGKTLRHACVTHRMVPGCVALPHGSWLDIDEETGIDRGGADNILKGSTTSVSGVTGWNSCLINIEKYNGKAIPADVDRPLRVIF